MQKSSCKTPEKAVNIPVKRSHFEYTLHQFRSEDGELKYAAIVNVLKETDHCTCLVGDYEIVEYKGARK